jgi:hypothetical protein
MPTEDHSSDRSHQGLPQGGVELSLDELAKGLASGNLSRAKALKLMGATLVGGALASIPGIAWAKPKPNGVKCNHNHQCASELCVDGVCGPACTPNTEACTSGTQCCSGNCKGGTCVASCIPPSATLCTPGSCPSACFCGSEPSGAQYCGRSVTSTSCVTSCDCPTGQFCEDFGTERLCASVC